MAKWLTCGCVALLTLMVGFQFVRTELERYDREHLSTEEAIREVNADNTELEAIYAQYQRQCDRKGITVEDMRRGVVC